MPQITTFTIKDLAVIEMFENLKEDCLECSSSVYGLNMLIQHETMSCYIG